MKNNLKKEIRNLLKGVKEKQDVLIIDSYNCDPGYYRHNDKIISEAELNELKKDFHNTVIFVLAGSKSLNGGANVINVTSRESAEKLKDFLIE
jgi:hypothetical protein